MEQIKKLPAQTESLLTIKTRVISYTRRCKSIEKLRYTALTYI